jgi:hypothetical protein
VSGYDWEPEHYDAAERAREWDRADDRERAEELERDRVTRDAGEGKRSPSLPQNSNGRWPRRWGRS